MFDSHMSAVVRTTGTWAALLFLIAAVALSTACSSSQGTGETAEPAGTQPGQQTFATVCAACHGLAGEGQPDWHIRKADGTLPAPPLNGTGHTWHHADGLLFRIVSKGGELWEDPSLPDLKSGMPGFELQLSREEIIDVLEYVKSLWVDRQARGVSIVEHQSRISETDPFPPPGDS